LSFRQRREEVDVALTLIQQHLATNLRRIRRERELSQKQIAQLAGVTQAYVSLVEHGWRPASLDRVEHLRRRSPSQSRCCWLRRHRRGPRVRARRSAAADNDTTSGGPVDVSPPRPGL
jgi:predicted XRE-type DNA-binding protein